jgi:Flp pilus assembly protein TadG
MRMPPHIRGNHRGNRRAAAAAELALLGPLLVTLVLAAVDVGRFAYFYIAVINAARAGASYAIMNNYSASTYGNWTAGITQAARDEISQQVGLANATNLTVTPLVTTDANGLKRVKVTASYPFSAVVNWQWFGLPQSLTLTNNAEMRLIR